MTLFYNTGLTALTLTSHTDGTPNINTWCSFVFRDNGGTVVGFRVWWPASASGDYTFTLWEMTNLNTTTWAGTSLGSKTVSSPYTGMTPSAWNDVMLDTPISVANNLVYAVSYYSDAGHYQFNGPNTLLTEHDTHSDEVWQYADGEDLSGFVATTGSNSARVAGFNIGSGNVIASPDTQGTTFYGSTPIWSDGGGEVSGTATATFSAPTSTINGTRQVPGTLVKVLSAPTATITGTRQVPGLFVGNMGALTGHILGTRYVPGTLTASFSLLATIVGERTHFGSATAVLGALNGTLVGGGDLANLITLADLTEAMGRDPYNAEEEAYWERIITTVSYYINSKVRVGFASTTVSATYQADSQGVIYLREPVTNIASITNYRTGNADLWVDFDGVCKLFYLEPHQVVNVVYTYGYSSVPQDIQDLAISLSVQQITEEMPTNLKRYKVGDVEQAYGGASTSQMMFDDMVNGVLDNYRRRWYTIPITIDVYPDYSPQGYVGDFD